MKDLSDLTEQMTRNRDARMFVEFCRAVAATPSRTQAVDELERRFGAHDAAVARYRKAAGAHTVPNSEFLVWTRLAREFMAVVQGSTILGRLRGTLPILLGASTPLLNDDVTLGFVGEADPIPAAQLGGDVKLEQARKLAGIAGFSKELVRSSDDRAVTVVERHVTAVLRREEDTALLSTAAATADAPGGLLEGVTASDTGDGIVSDLQALVASVRSGAPIAPTFVTSLSGLVALAGAHLLNADGTLAGAPVINSPSAGSRLILIDGAAVGVWDAGLAIDSARDATIEFSATPSGAGPFTSAFQANLAMVRLVRYVSWVRAHDDAVGFVDLLPGSPA